MSSQPVGQSTNQSVNKNVKSFCMYVFKVVAGSSVSTNIQEPWSSDSALNLLGINPLNVGSSVKKIIQDPLR